MSKLIELTYVSEPAQNMSFLGLMRLLYHSYSNNQALGITGALIYENNQFGQVIEGERANVLKAWKRIQDDKRHHRIELLEIRDITERTYPDWLLRFYGGESLTKDYPALASMVGGMDKHSLDLMNRMREAAL